MKLYRYDYYTEKIESVDVIAETKTHYFYLLEKSFEYGCKKTNINKKSYFCTTQKQAIKNEIVFIKRSIKISESDIRKSKARIKILETLQQEE
jgi:hypothetical protein